MAKPTNNSNPQVVDMSAEVEPPVPADLSLNDEVKQAIKTRFMKPDLTVGKAHMLDPRTHFNVDYTAGGQLHTRWVINNDAEIQRKAAKGFVMPETISPRLKNIRQGNMVLMVRPMEYNIQHQENVEKLNRKWEADSSHKTRKKDLKSQGIDEYEVTPQAAKRS